MYTDNGTSPLKDVDEVILVEFNRMLDWATEVIASVDRSVLGSFALREEIVVAEYARHFSTLYDLTVMEIVRSDDITIIPDGGFSQVQVQEVAERISAHFYWLATGSNHLGDFTAETWLWYCVINDIAFDDLYAETMQGHTAPATLSRFRLLQKVYNNPANLRFYEVDIWDNAFISRCIVDGVDTSLARELYDNEAGTILA